MSDPDIRIEALSDTLLETYRTTTVLDRGDEGAEAISWAFQSNPNPFAVARHNDEIVGLSAYVKTRMKFGAARGHGYQAVDSFVSSTMRGKGVFTKLASTYDDYVGETGDDLVWGFPNNQASHAWFGKLDWHTHGQIPFMIKPLRSGFFTRKMGLGLDFSISRARDQNLTAISSLGAWSDALWDRVEHKIGCGTIRDQQYLTHRLFAGPQASKYRTVASTDPNRPALVATHEAEKHGGHIAYLLEALGGVELTELLVSELGRLRGRGVELALAWAYPWSPNYQSLRKAGFFPLPERLRPIQIWFGSRPKTPGAQLANFAGQWYLSYLDSDTI